MKTSEKYDRTLTGVLPGIIVPLFIILLFFIWKADTLTFVEFFNKLVETGVLSNVISVSVFANVFLFLLFNRFDMLKASKGILGVTIIWAIAVFIIKLS